MYDIKRLEIEQQQQQKYSKNLTTTTATAPFTPHLLGTKSLQQFTCSVITPPTHTQTHNTTTTATTIAGSYNNNSSYDPATATHMTLLTLRRRRMFQRRACLLSILAAFIFGLALGVFLPMYGLPEYFSSDSSSSSSSNGISDFAALSSDLHALPLPLPLPLPSSALKPINISQLPTLAAAQHPPSDFPTIYEPHAPTPLDAASSSAERDSVARFSVAFIKDAELELSAEQVFRNAFHLEQDKHSTDTMIVKKLDTNDGSIREFSVQRLPNGRFRKGAERRLSKPTLEEQVLTDNRLAGDVASINFVPMAQRIVESARNERNQGIIKSDIYWGDLVERALPQGFGKSQNSDWEHYVASGGIVTRLEPGCGRMQNRLVIFADGTRACARYRQNTDQIQGELFSFLLGQLLNLTNLAPSAATVIDTTSRTWSAALDDITQAQWKEHRPVVLTRWLSDLEPAGIPQPFQPLERHLNKYDVWNITLGAAAEAVRSKANKIEYDTIHQQRQHETTVERGRGLFKRLEAASSQVNAHQSNVLSQRDDVALENDDVAANRDGDGVAAAAVAVGESLPVLQRLIELAQWSDLIVFDYLIANLDRVVNNLYNFQWNADIMAAPAHNLARQLNTQLLVFLDNESGLLHGYRLLKKYEAYHSLLLDNLCVFRQPTIEALRRLRDAGAGRRLRELFEQTTNGDVRDVLPSLPDKSIKILVERIDRVLGQVQKCRDLLADR